MAKSARDSSLDAVKGFTILIVMLGHVLVLNKINDPVIYDWIKAVQMPLFMMVSGYLCGKAAKAGSFADYGRMLKKRCTGYLLPFFAWTLVFHLDDFTWAFPAYLEQPALHKPALSRSDMDVLFLSPDSMPDSLYHNTLP